MPLVSPLNPHGRLAEGLSCLRCVRANLSDNCAGTTQDARRKKAGVFWACRLHSPDLPSYLQWSMFARATPTSLNTESMAVFYTKSIFFWVHSPQTLLSRHLLDWDRSDNLRCGLESGHSQSATTQLLCLWLKYCVTTWFRRSWWCSSEQMFWPFHAHRGLHDRWFHGLTLEDWHDYHRGFVQRRANNRHLREQFGQVDQTALTKKSTDFEHTRLFAHWGKP